MISVSGGVKSAAKSAAETALVFGGAAAARRKRFGQLLVLAYHNIVPTGASPVGDRSLHLSQIAFAEQLDALRETHDVVSLADAFVTRPDSGAARDQRPRVAITFDDAYSGALTAGVAELRARGMPATVFITPALINGKTFWWDVLADATKGLDTSLRVHALTEAQGLTDDVVALARATGLHPKEMPAHARAASEHELAAALNDAPISFAAHTWRHPNLVSLGDSDLADELARPLEWLQRFGERMLPMISYPYGLADRRVMNAARTAGYTAAFMIDGGWTTPTPTDHFAIPRLNVPAGVSRNGFVLRAAGLIES